jgi:hypothetical protein
MIAHNLEKMLDNEKLDRINKIRENLIEARNNRLRDTIEYFSNLKPFTSPDDIPDVPVVDAETYQSVIIPNIIRCGAIPKKDLKVGTIYLGNCRNTTKAKWTGTEFVYNRCKFGMWYEDSINHFEDDDGYDVFVPIKEYEFGTIDVEV